MYTPTPLELNIILILMLIVVYSVDKGNSVLRYTIFIIAAILNVVLVLPMDANLVTIVANIAILYVFVKRGYMDIIPSSVLSKEKLTTRERTDCTNTLESWKNMKRKHNYYIFLSFCTLIVVAIMDRFL